MFYLKTQKQQHEEWQKVQQENLQTPFSLGTLDGMGNTNLDQIEFPVLKKYGSFDHLFTNKQQRNYGHD